MPEPQFPIYCKSNVSAFMIISKTRVMTITNGPTEFSMGITEFGNLDHNIYELWEAGELEESNQKDFHIYRIEMNNRLISVGVSKEAQNTKSES